MGLFTILTALCHISTYGISVALFPIKAITISVIVFFLKQQKLSDWDTIKSNKYTKAAISYLLYCKNEDCPKDIVIPFEY